MQNETKLPIQLRYFTPLFRDSLMVELGCNTTLSIYWKMNDITVPLKRVAYDLGG